MLLLTISTVLFAPAANAWEGSTHSQIVDLVYYSLPSDVQNKLNLQAMEQASDDPDNVFHDTRIHNYPRSYDKAMEWLNKGKIAYDSGDYSGASYDFGVASHYISDTFSAPHGVSGESDSKHSKYEYQASKLTPLASFESGDLKSLMQEGYNQGAVSWNQLLQTEDSSIIQRNLNAGASAALTAIANTINGVDPNQQTDTTNNSGFTSNAEKYKSPSLSGLNMVNAQNQTANMKPTGFPLPLLVLAVLLVIGGLFGVKRR